MSPRWGNLSLLLLSCIAALSAVSDASSIGVDGLALLSFKSLVGDPDGALASWDNASSNFCQWEGVTCGIYDGQQRVTSLDLQLKNLNGSISPHVGNLSFLQRLHLPENNLQGPMPPELAQLSFLRHLNLSFNPLGGKFPDFLFDNCSHLQNLILDHNYFHGAFPRNISRCRDLRILSLKGNMFKGPVPGEIGSLSKLWVLSLHGCNLSGSIPPEIGNLPLTHLTLSENALTGEIPTSFWNLSSLVNLRLYENELSGSLPQSMGESLPNLQALMLNSNQFHGRLPASLSNASNLWIIQVLYNSFSGQPPRSWGALQSLENIALYGNLLEASNAEDWEFVSAWSNCTSLQILDLGMNQLGGILPRSLVNLSTTLRWLQLAENKIAGSIPAEIGSLKSLETFFVHSNLLQGDIPATLGDLSRIVLLNFSDNKLTGRIPATLGKLSHLNILIISLNELGGPIPPSLGNCTSLHSLDLGFNRLTGALPREILQFPIITFLYMPNNLLTGPLPPEVGSLQNIEVLDISGNRFSGMIPSSLGGCLHLQRLVAAGNSFQGPIPSSFSQLKGLQDLDLSRNNFSGRIPEFLTSIRLSSLDLSFNSFDGQVPLGGIFSNVSAFSVLGNGKLCGGVPQLHLPPCHQLQGQNSPRKKLSELTLIILLATGASCAILLCALICILRRYKYEKLITADTDINYGSHAMVTYYELRKATNGFSTENLIGAGGFGSVYKGLIQWDEGNLTVAVKVFNLQQRGASRSFLAECMALRHIRHRNLVGVITACSSTDFRGNAFKALIYEFMPNGSLESWLHPETNDRSLSLAQRLNISIDVASAVDYLHNRHGTQIIHADLKPSNVLLGDDMTAHVGDFGLARFANKVPGSSFRKSSTTSTAFKGTIGYVAPEYGVGNKVSAEGDVYSYGMLLLEMFTGRRPTDEMFTGGFSLHGYVATALPGRVAEVVDRNMLMGVAVGGAVLDCLRTVLEIGVACSKELPAERMQIEDAVNKLTATRDAYIRNESS